MFWAVLSLTVSILEPIHAFPRGDFDVNVDVNINGKPVEVAPPEINDHQKHDQKPRSRKESGIESLSLRNARAKMQQQEPFPHPLNPCVDCSVLIKNGNCKKDPKLMQKYCTGLCPIDYSDACDQKPCQNGATCYANENKDYHCKCVENYTGKNCERKEHEYQSLGYVKWGTSNQHKLKLSQGSEGTVMVKMSGKNIWQGICDDKFTRDDDDVENLNGPNVVCRMLGFPRANGVTRESEDGMINGSDDFAMDDVECTGSEASLEDCDYITTDEDCDNTEYAGVSCVVDEPLSDKY